MNSKLTIRMAPTFDISKKHLNTFLFKNVMTFNTLTFIYFYLLLFYLSCDGYLFNIFCILVLHCKVLLNIKYKRHYINYCLLLLLIIIIINEYWMDGIHLSGIKLT